MMNYSWKMKGLAHGVDPSVAVQELKRLQDLHGTITPEVIVSESKNTESPLHSIFEWDNKKAAHGYRIQQARVMLNNIQVTTLSDGEPKNISVYEVTTFNEGYKSIDTFTPDDIEYIKSSVKRQLEALKIKLSQYNEFKRTIRLIDAASSSLEATLYEIDKKRKQPIDLAVKN